MKTVNPYLIFNGNCMEAFTFYKTVFGGEFTHIVKYKDIPSDSEFSAQEGRDHEKIMHIALPFMKQNELMGSDISEEFVKTFVEGNNFSISINTNSVEEVERVFEALSAGGRKIIPLHKTFWKTHFGMLKDKFGINWMINCEPYKLKDKEDKKE